MKISNEAFLWTFNNKKYFGFFKFSFLSFKRLNKNQDIVVITISKLYKRTYSFLKKYSDGNFTIILLDELISAIPNLINYPYLWWTYAPIIFKNDNRLSNYDNFVVFDTDLWINTNMSNIYNELEISDDCPIYGRKGRISRNLKSDKFKEQKFILFNTAKHANWNDYYLKNYINTGLVIVNLKSWYKNLYDTESEFSNLLNNFLYKFEEFLINNKLNIKSARFSDQEFIFDLAYNKISPSVRKKYNLPFLGRLSFLEKNLASDYNLHFIGYSPFSKDLISNPYNCSKRKIRKFIHVAISSKKEFKKYLSKDSLESRALSERLQQCEDEIFQLYLKIKNEK